RYEESARCPVHQNNEPKTPDCTARQHRNVATQCQGGVATGERISLNPRISVASLWLLHLFERKSATACSHGISFRSGAFRSLSCLGNHHDVQPRRCQPTTPASIGNLLFLILLPWTSVWNIEGLTNQKHFNSSHQSAYVLAQSAQPFHVTDQWTVDI
uniref:Uncharacterized protein n=1 Tax=Aegilops tauschii subsp. strangulata TaxID=200361 RepID=A0A453SB81_AEGTS